MFPSKRRNLRNVFSGLLDRFIIKKPRFRRWLTRVIYGNSDRIITILGSDLNINTALENGYFRAANAAETLSVFRDEASVIINISALIEEGDVFVDIGANVGLYSSIISRLREIKGYFDIVAFEVHHDTFSRLRRNASLHGFRPVCVGVSSATGRKKFVSGAVSHVTAAFENINSYNISSEVFENECISLSSFEFPPYRGKLILKIDVEGHEMAILDGANDLFSRGRVKAVYIDGFDDERVIPFLEGHGFKFYDGRTLAPSNGNVFSLLALSYKEAPAKNERFQ